MNDAIMALACFANLFNVYNNNNNTTSQKKRD